MTIENINKDLRRTFSKNGWILLVYYLIMNVCVSIAIVFDAIILWFQYLYDQTVLTEDFGTLLIERSTENGIGYLLACLIGAGILLFWKNPNYCFREIWHSEKRMTAKAFIVLLCAFLSGQAVQILLTPVLELLLNIIGLSAMSSLETAVAGSTTLSMFLYVSVFAPVFEEMLFRGLILRNLLPYGRKMAILGSAFLFGVFHGNLVQTPFAFLVGLVLGYTAVKYGLVWSVILHAINNFVLGDLFSRLTQWIPAMYVDLLLYVILFGVAILTLVLAAVNSRKITDYFSTRKIHPLCLRCFFLSPGVMVFSGIMIINMILLLLT